MLRHDGGHLVIDPVFASVSHRNKDSDCLISIDVDDCDCAPCIMERGPIPIYATISIELVAGKTRISQRLTPNEARKIAKTLLNYATVVDTVSEVDKVDLT